MCIYLNDNEEIDIANLTEIQKVYDDYRMIIIKREDGSFFECRANFGAVKIVRNEKKYQELLRLIK